ncbi:MAG TPA: hypothetical protein VGR89_08810 [Puia sp.]|nr:hypothetical protein [Puia sp.]
MQRAFTLEELLGDSPDNPDVALQIQAQTDGPFEFWSELAIVDQMGRTKLLPTVDNAAQVPLGKLKSLINSTLNIFVGTNEVDTLRQGAVSYDLLYNGSPTNPQRVEVDTLKKGIFHFTFTFCPRHPFC